MPKAKPGLLVALFRRAPVVLYRAHLGWILGGHFLMLTTTGRKTGRTRRTVLEVMRRADRSTGALPTLWVVASRGRQTDWYANAVAGGSTGVTWKFHAFTPRLHALDAAERAELLLTTGVDTRAPPRYSARPCSVATSPPSPKTCGAWPPSCARCDSNRPAQRSATLR